jgi:hypothetical protein
VAAVALVVGLQWLALYGNMMLIELTVFILPLFSLVIFCVVLLPPGSLGKWRFGLLGVLGTTVVVNSYIVLRTYAHAFIQ